jgi:membrane fusion protein, macrolide-specific efflux system
VDIPKIKAGQKAVITLDAFTGKTYVGEVENVDSVGTNNSGVVTYNVYLKFISPPADIKPGMTTTAVITIDRKDNALTVPSAAIQTTNGESLVRVLKNGQVSQVTVETGISSDSSTEIISGLSEGDTIITSTYSSQSSSSSNQSTSLFSGNRGFGGSGAALRVAH